MQRIGRVQQRGHVRGGTLPLGGQRQSPGRAVSALLVCALGAVEGASGEPLRVDTPAPVLRIAEAHGHVVACMGLNGVAFVDPAAAEADVREAWPTLAAESQPNGRVLLSGRDSIMRVVDLADGGAAAETAFEWPVEGLPNDSSTLGDLTALACGGAGVSLWEWRAQDSPPHLIARYPFIGFAKQVVFHAEGVLLVADAHEVGLVALDVGDPYRPHKLGTFPMRGFCDAVESDGETILAVNRYSGVIVLEPQKGFAGFDARQAIAPLVGSAEYKPGTVSLAGGRLLLPEMASGLRILDRRAEGFERSDMNTSPKIAMDAVALGDGRIAVADFANAVVILPVAEEVAPPRPVFPRRN